MIVIADKRGRVIDKGHPDVLIDRYRADPVLCEFIQMVANSPYKKQRKIGGLMIYRVYFHSLAAEKRKHRRRMLRQAAQQAKQRWQATI